MNREKAIKGFECCMTDMNRSDSMSCRSCPYGTLPKKENCQKQMFADVLALLKEQEAVKPIITDHIVFGTNRKCSKCNRYIFPAGRYCPYCGRSVRWEDD